MEITFDRESQRAQREFLRQKYDDYDPRHHDLFVFRYNKETEGDAMRNYMINRGIITD
jgi:hypothetical protein